jgi:ribosomal protein S16
MEKEDLIKKLEGIKLPEIEIKSHRERLKLALLKNYLRETRKGELFGFLRKAVPAAAFLVISCFLIFNNLIFPKYNLAKAKEIALQSEEIKSWIDKGATIKDAKVIDGKAYVLIQPAESEKKIIETEENQNISEFKSGAIAPSAAPIVKEEEFKGAVAEINIKEKKVSNIEKLSPTIANLIENKKGRALEIANKSQDIQKIIPKEAEILDISVSTPRFKLTKRGNSILVQPETETEEKASIIYQFDGNRWEGKINLDEEKVEEVKFLGEIENGATLEK